MAHTHSPEKCMYWKKRTERISAAEELDVGWLRREGGRKGGRKGGREGGREKGKNGIL